VAVGSEDGTVHALDRSSGERLWQGTITGEVNRIAVTPFNVWVRNTESGVFALDRDDGTVVHRSSHGSGGGIAVVNDILLMDTGDNITAYWIE
jgi:outer membrane protein assembly factor BamB